MRIRFTMMFAVVAVLSGCVTTEEPPVVLDAREASAFASTFKDPRRYGMNLYRKDSGATGVAGGFRLHPTQATALPMLASAVPFRPFIEVISRSFSSYPALLDISSADSWSDYSMHGEMKMVLLGDRKAFLYAGSRDTGGVPAYRSVCTQMRLDQLHIENALFYTRLESRGLGPIARGIDDLPFKLVLGWDVVRNFGQVRFDYEAKQIQFYVGKTTEALGEFSLGSAVIQSTRGEGCVVLGEVDGAPQLFVLDPVGDFELAWPGKAAATVARVNLGSLALAEVSLADVAVDGPLPRIGGRLLSKYTVTLCPQDKRVYFDRPVRLEEK